MTDQNTTSFKTVFVEGHQNNEDLKAKGILLDINKISYFDFDLVTKDGKGESLSFNIVIDGVEKSYFANSPEIYNEWEWSLFRVIHKYLIGKV